MSHDILCINEEVLGLQSSLLSPNVSGLFKFFEVHEHNMIQFLEKIK